MKEETFTCGEEYPISSPIKPLTFWIDGEDTWMLKFSEEGIVFNRDAYPHWDAEDFAREFMIYCEKMCGSFE